MRQWTQYDTGYTGRGKTRAVRRTGSDTVGFMRWLRGGDDDSTATAMMSAGLAEIAGVFQPTRHKQTEHVEEQKRRRIDVANGTGIDLDRGVAVIRRTTPPEADTSG